MNTPSVLRCDMKFHFVVLFQGYYIARYQIETQGHLIRLKLRPIHHPSAHEK